MTATVIGAFRSELEGGESLSMNVQFIDILLSL